MSAAASAGEAPRLWGWAASDPGKRRERNEDSYLLDLAVGVLAVADGMGGHLGGATASRMAVEHLGRELRDARGDFLAAVARDHGVAPAGAPRTTEPMAAASDDLVEAPTMPPGELLSLASTWPGSVLPALELMRGAVRRASSAIFDLAHARPALRGMGTTLTAGLVHGGQLHLVHAGDSRCYLYRDGELRQLTDDHSWIAEQLRAGTMSEAEAKASRYRHVITRSIGFERDAEADVRSLDVQAGDVLVLCSDGMSNYVEAPELAELVARTPCRRLPTSLIELANARGGDDNITVVVGLVAHEPPAP